MRLPKRTFYSLVLALCGLNVLLRYPISIPHEMGSDTTFIHSLAASIARQGHAVWILHVLSYVGLYALSYPSGIPFLSASTSVVAGVPIEGAFLILSLVLGVLGPLGMILVGQSLTRDNRFALVLALVMTFSPFYIKDTTWIGASRGFVVSLVPFILFFSVRLLRQRSATPLVLLLVILFTTSAIHRMGVLSFVILASVLFVGPFHKVTQRLRFALVRHERNFRIASVGLAMVGFLGMFYVQFQFPGIAGVDVRQQYGGGTLFRGNSFGILVLNMAVSFIGKVGILLPLAAVGLATYTWKRPKDAPDKFVLLAVLIFLPLLSMRDYITEFVIPLLAVLVVFAMFRLTSSIERRRKIVAVSVAGALLLGAGAFAWEMKGYWADRYGTDAPIPDGTYVTSLYVRFATNGTILTNHGLTGGRITAISDRPTLPLGGASLHWFSSQQLIFGFVAPNQVQVYARDLSTITFNTDDLFAPVNVRNAEFDWETILYHRLDDPVATRLLGRYDCNYIALDLAITSGNFRSYGLDRDSPFIRDALQERYVVFSTPAEVIYYIG